MADILLPIAHSLPALNLYTRDEDDEDSRPSTQGDDAESFFASCAVAAIMMIEMLQNTLLNPPSLVASAASPFSYQPHTRTLSDSVFLVVTVVVTITLVWMRATILPYLSLDASSSSSTSPVTSHSSTPARLSPIAMLSGTSVIVIIIIIIIIIMIVKVLCGRLTLISVCAGPVRRQCAARRSQLRGPALGNVPFRSSIAPRAIHSVAAKATARPVLPRHATAGI